MLGECLQRTRACVPLVHNITNYVTVNDVANALLACGASPIMSDEPQDVADITSICGGLNINIGTLNARSIEAMQVAGARAAELGHVILLDPVGAGASTLRTSTALRFIEQLPLTAVKGNASEIKALALGSATTQGVDANAADVVTEENLAVQVEFAKSYARELAAAGAGAGAVAGSGSVGAADNAGAGVDAAACAADNAGASTGASTGVSAGAGTAARAGAAGAGASQQNCILAITGPIDLVTDGTRCFAIRNGRPEMEKITGTGCQIAGLMTAYLVANPTASLEAAAAAVALMGVAGEIAWDALQPNEGNATYRNRIIDAICNMDAETLEARVCYEVL